VNTVDILSADGAESIHVEVSKDDVGRGVAHVMAARLT
jgi:hypothetical protein